MEHNHYFKDVSRYDVIDVYRVLTIFDVFSPPLQHAIKKLLCAGARGYKDDVQDLREAIDSILRAIEMIEEDEINDKP